MPSALLRPLCRRSCGLWILGLRYCCSWCWVGNGCCCQDWLWRRFRAWGCFHSGCWWLGRLLSWALPGRILNGTDQQHHPDLAQRDRDSVGEFSPMIDRSRRLSSPGHFCNVHSCPLYGRSQGRKADLSRRPAHGSERTTKLVRAGRPSRREPRVLPPAPAGHCALWPRSWPGSDPLPVHAATRRHTPPRHVTNDAGRRPSRRAAG